MHVFILSVPILLQQLRRKTVSGEWEVSFQNNRLIFHDHVFFDAIAKGQQVHADF